MTLPYRLQQLFNPPLADRGWDACSAVKGGAITTGSVSERCCAAKPTDVLEGVARGEGGGGGRTSLPPSGNLIKNFPATQHFKDQVLTVR